MRRYHEQGTNGTLRCAGRLVCHTIELPWKQNLPLRSCIPEGRYLLRKRYSPRFKWHLLVTGVPGRSHILVHPANDALRELNGCIAPVCTLTAPGKGLLSKNAMERLKAVVYRALEQEPVFLIIKKEK